MPHVSSAPLSVAASLSPDIARVPRGTKPPLLTAPGIKCKADTVLLREQVTLCVDEALLGVKCPA